MTLRTRTGIAAMVFVAVLSGAVAVAAWLVSGTGPAASAATTAASFTVTAGTATPGLYPGATGPVYATVSNSNPFPVTLTGATFGVVTVDTGHAAACPASNVTTTGPVTFAPTTLTARASATPVTINNALQMLATAANGCQGATFTVQVTLSGTSA